MVELLDTVLQYVGKHPEHGIVNVWIDIYQWNQVLRKY